MRQSLYAIALLAGLILAFLMMSESWGQSINGCVAKNDNLRIGSSLDQCKTKGPGAETPVSWNTAGALGHMGLSEGIIVGISTWSPQRAY